jgi:hypothetical protein
MKKQILSLLAIVCTLSAVAQIDLPAPSPAATLTQKFGLAELKIEYSRPSVKGRKVFGNVVSYDSIWRTGANESTKFTITDSVTIAGKGLAKGTYVLLTRPSKGSWDIIFNKNLNVSYSNYLPEYNVLTVNVKPITTNYTTETFNITTNNIKLNECTVQLAWENTIAEFTVINDPSKKILKQIKQKLDGPTASEYNAMARYYLENNLNMEEALVYINKAVIMDEGYGNLRNKSLILAKMGDKKLAIETAKKSLERAVKNKNLDYIRMNNESIAEWSK